MSEASSTVSVESAMRSFHRPTLVKLLPMFRTRQVTSKVSPPVAVSGMPTASTTRSAKGAVTLIGCSALRLSARVSGSMTSAPLSARTAMK